MSGSKRAHRSVGQFVWNTTTDHWHWDVGMYELHGYREGAVAVSTDLVLAHKHDDHRAHASAVLEASAAGDQRFSNYHHIVDVEGRRRTVLTVGESRADRSRPTQVHRLSRGFMVDVTLDEHDSTRRAVEQARRSTAAVQQSSGLLMGSLGLTEDAALEMLKRVSSRHNVRLRDLAARFMSVAVSATDSPVNLSQTLVEQAAALALERTLEQD